MLLNQEVVALGLGVVIFWLVVTSFFLYRVTVHYRKLTAGVNRGNLSTVLEKILKEQEVSTKGIGELVKRAEKIEKKGEFHIQKIGLVRFNPFSQVGGDQSFALAILDGEKSGIVISSLHSREATRLYAKPVKGGRVEGYQFSKEEADAISKACKQQLNER